MRSLSIDSTFPAALDFLPVHLLGEVLVRSKEREELDVLFLEERHDCGCGSGLDWICCLFVDVKVEDTPHKIRLKYRTFITRISTSPPSASRCDEFLFSV